MVTNGPGRHGFSRREWAIIVGCVAALAAEAAFIVHAHYYTQDFNNGYRAAWALRQLIHPSVAAPNWVRSNTSSNYFYDPTFVLLILPLTLLPLPDATLVWYGCLSVFLAVSLYALLRAAGVQPSLPDFLAVLTAMAVTSEVRAEYSLGQVDLLVVCCIALALWQRQERRTILAGVLLAAACLIKPMFLTVPVLLLWKREYRMASVALGSFLILLLAPFLVLGSRALADLLAAWRLMGGAMLAFLDNIGPRGMLARLLAPNLYLPPILNAPALATALWLAIAAVAILLTLAVVAPVPLRRDPASLLDVGLILATTLIVSPLTESTYLDMQLVALLAMLLLLRSVDWRRGPYRVTAVGLLIVWLLTDVSARYHTVNTRVFGHTLYVSPVITYTLSRFDLVVGVFALVVYTLAVYRSINVGGTIARLARGLSSALRRATPRSRLTPGLEAPRVATVDDRQ